MTCTAKSCIADGTYCTWYYVCDLPKKRVSVAEKCKAQHLTWKEIIGCILFVLWGSINI
jgi:hypothetical protein